MFERQPWMQRAGDHPGSDQEYFELLARVVFAAGLGPRVVEARWDGIRSAMCGLEPEGVAAMGPAEVDRLLGDPGVIRNRRKIEAVVGNARVFLDLVAEAGSFGDYLGSIGVAADFSSAAKVLAERFGHLGPTSAALFLFSAGWREQVEEEAA